MFQYNLFSIYSIPLFLHVIDDFKIPAFTQLVRFFCFITWTAKDDDLDALLKGLDYDVVPSKPQTEVPHVSATTAGSSEAWKMIFPRKWILKRSKELHKVKGGKRWLLLFGMYCCWFYLLCRVVGCKKLSHQWSPFSTHAFSPEIYTNKFATIFLAVLGYVIRVYPHSQRFLSIIAVCHCEAPNVYFNGWGLRASKFQKKELQLYVPSFSIQPRWNWTFFVCIYTYTNVIYLFLSMYLYVNGDAEILEDVVCEYIRRFLMATL